MDLYDVLVTQLQLQSLALSEDTIKAIAREISRQVDERSDLRAIPTNVIRQALPTIQIINAQNNSTIRDVAQHAVNVLVQQFVDDPASTIPASCRNDGFCPYPGLASFTQEHSAHFYGRDDDIKRIVKALEHPCIAITGASGVGKSSLIHAGVLPVLVRADDQEVQTHSFSMASASTTIDLRSAFLASILPISSDDISVQLAHDQQAFDSLLNQYKAEDKRTIIIIDQFEELFVGNERSSERQLFLDMLVDYIQKPIAGYTIVLVTRENFFEHPDYLARPTMRTIVQETNIPIGPLSEPQLRMAIEQPLRYFNSQNNLQLRFQQGLIDLIVNTFRQSGVTLPLVQYLLRLLWIEKGHLTHVAYNNLGGLDRVLDRHASQIYHDFSDQEQALVDRLLLALIRPGIEGENTRTRVNPEDLILPYDTPDQTQRLHAIIRRLTGETSRIISEVANAKYIELTHEVIVKQWELITQLAKIYKERLQEREQLLATAEQWEASRSSERPLGDTSYLYRGSELKHAQRFIEDSRYRNHVDRRILVCYEQSRRWQRKVQRRFATIGLLIALIVAAISYFSIQGVQSARNEQATAQANQVIAANQQATAEAKQIIAQNLQATADANALQEAERARREAEIATAQRLANLARQTFAQGDRPLALALALEAVKIPEPPLQTQQALAEIAYAPGYAGVLGTGVAISPDGTHILDVRDDGTVLLKNVSANTEQNLGSVRFEGAFNTKFNVAQFSADGTWIVVGTRQEIVSWQVADGKELSRIPFPEGTIDGVDIWQFSISPYDRTFLVQTSVDEIQLRNLTDGRVIQQFKGDGIGIGTMSPDKRYLFVGSGTSGPGENRFTSGSATLWDLQTGEPLGNINGTVADSLVFLPTTLPSNGIVGVAFAGIDQNIHVWSYDNNTKNFTEDSVLNDAQGPIIWSPDTETLVATKPDGTGLRLWNLNFNRLPSSSQVLAGAGIPLSFIGKSQLAILRNGTIIRYDLSNAAQISGLPIPSALADYIGTYSIAVSPDGKQIVEGNNQPDMTVFSFGSPSDALRSEIGRGYLPVANSADRSVLLLSLSSPPLQSIAQKPKIGTYQVFDWKSNTITHIVEGAGSITWPTHPHASINRDGSRAMVLLPIDKQRNAIVKIIDLQSGQEFASFGEPTQSYANIELSPDGKTGLTLMAPHRKEYGDLTNTGSLSLLVWDTETATLRTKLDVGQEPTHPLETFYREPTDLSFSPDGTMFSLSVSGGKICVWDTKTLKELWCAPTLNDRVIFSLDSESLVSNGQQENVTFYDARTGALQRILSEARVPVLFSDDGTTITTGDTAQQVRVWDVASGTELRRFPLYADLLSLAITPDGKHLFTGSADGTKQWHNHSLADLVTWTRANREVTQLTCEQRARYQILPLCDPNAPTSTVGVQTPTMTIEPLKQPEAVATQLIQPTPTTSPTPTLTGCTVYVLADSLDGQPLQTLAIHEEAGLNPPTIGYLKRGEQSKRINSEERTADGRTWIQIQTADVTGWASLRALKCDN